MTNLQEAKLAREAEMSYATMAMVTDYDCWREGHDDVTVEQVVAVIHQNSANAQKVVRAAVAALPQGEKSPYADVPKYAIMTDKKMIPAGTRERLKLLIAKYMEA